MQEGVQVEGENEHTVINVNRYQTEDSAIFVDYQKDILLLSLKVYNTLNIYHRNSLAKNIDSIRAILYPDPQYFDWLQLIAQDNEQIQHQLFAFLKTHYHSIQFNQHRHLEFLLPLIRIATSCYLQFKEESCSLLCQVLSDMDSQELGNVTDLLYETAEKDGEESKVAAMHLAARLMPFVGEDQKQELFKRFYLESYTKASVRFKKEIIHSCEFISKGQQQKFIDQKILTGFFFERCREPIWGIRKACVEVLPKLLALTKIHKQALSFYLLTFTRDGSKIVKSTAFKIIPEFLANFGDENVPTNLFNIYCALLTHPINKELTRQFQMAQKMAFYFPGIVQVCGVSKWGKLHDILLDLLDKRCIDVKISIASSLHQIARVIGPTMAQKSLFKIVDRLLNEETEEIKLAVVSIFSEFVAIFDANNRETLIDFFLVLQKDPKKWRIRYEMTRQLGSLAVLYSSEVNSQYIFPINLKLCNDSHSLVREEAALHVHEVVLRMFRSSQAQQMAIQSILHLGSSSVFIQRQTFAFMVQGMLEIATFREKVMGLLTSIAKDNIIGVRAALARSLRHWQQRNETDQNLLDIIQLLSNDEEECVASQLLPKKLKT